MTRPLTAFSQLGDCLLMENGDFWLLEQGGCWLLERDLNNTPYSDITKNKTAYQEA